MTTATIFKQQNKYGSYGGCENGYGLYSRGEIRLGASDLDHMAEDDDQSRSSSSSSSTEDDPDLEIVMINKREVEGEEGSRNDDGDERWLRLGLNDDGDDDDRIDKIDAPMNRRSSGELVELDLLPIISREHVNNTTNNNNHNHHNYHNYHNYSSSSSSSCSYRSCSSTVQHHHHHHHHQQQQQLSVGHMMMSRSASTNFPITLNFPPSSSPWNNNNNNNNMCYSSVELPFQFQYSASPSPSLDIRVTDVPSSRRTGSGVWFVLQASSNQGREPFLPQIPKSYLRIKDGRMMTVGLVIKYLVNKLKLNSESEIELTCRGLQLLPFFTLLHVRDSIWSASRDAVTLLSDSSTTDHLMILCYGRSAG
ncbi:hypothetical protein Scep_018291 [Stephania cephalantha]|uniref:Uncharacterized protein n=1 Tax=Stephania cephalantha TaxID=152367 RepID=A0AAP0ISI7_9MAGN